MLKTFDAMKLSDFDICLAMHSNFCFQGTFRPRKSKGQLSPQKIQVRRKIRTKIATREKLKFAILNCIFLPHPAGHSLESGRRR
jgi:hypothetical protein